MRRPQTGKLTTTINNQDSNEHSSLRQESGLIKMLSKQCQLNEWDNHIRNHLSGANGPLSKVNETLSGSGNPQPANHQRVEVSLDACPFLHSSLGICFGTIAREETQRQVGFWPDPMQPLLSSQAQSNRPESRVRGVLQKARGRGQLNGCPHLPSQNSLYQNYR